MPGRTEPEQRNLVLLCDGTGNEIGFNISNVLKLYRIAEKDRAQHVYYDPGIGTVAQMATWGRLKQKVRTVFGLATGYGLDDNILDAYRYLCATYRTGDRIFLFGFSRGAYTVRALAGMINMVGLLRADQLNIASYALTAYKRASEKNNLRIAWQFARISGSQNITIHFVGVWDSVASVLVPRPDRGYIPSLEFLPYTKQNSRVHAFRQAYSIDERRSMFRPYRWNPGQQFMPKPFSQEGVGPQDSKEVWFAGTHSDVGGGYAEAESGLSKFPLIWMIDQAVAHGLRVIPTMIEHLAFGKPVTGGLYPYVPPNPAARLHRSLKGAWWLLEIFPKRAKWLGWPRKWTFLGLYLPLAEPRFIDEGSTLHRSVIERMRAVPSYRPINLPDKYSVED